MVDFTIISGLLYKNGLNAVLMLSWSPTHLLPNISSSFAIGVEKIHKISSKNEDG